jgi:hypothetical protein
MILLLFPVDNMKISHFAPTDDTPFSNVLRLVMSWLSGNALHVPNGTDDNLSVYYKSLCKLTAGKLDEKRWDLFLQGKNLCCETRIFPVWQETTSSHSSAFKAPFFE